MKFVKSLDFFTKAKEDIESSTGIGGLFSLIGLVVIFPQIHPNISLNLHQCGILFFIIEISSFLGTVHVKEMTINNDSITKKERVNIDFTFLKAPCGCNPFSLCFCVLSSNSAHFNSRRRRKSPCCRHPPS